MIEANEEKKETKNSKWPGDLLLCIQIERRNCVYSYGFIVLLVLHPKSTYICKWLTRDGESISVQFLFFPFSVDNFI